MQILLSCAKTMLDSTTVRPPFISQPHFKAEANRFALQLAQWPTETLAKTLQCSIQIAAKNRLRYIRFFDEGGQLPAVLSYFGQAFKYLSAQTFTPEDFKFAQSHLWITSYLYGLLRPLDLIHPYRLEGSVVLDSGGGKDLFNFWKERLTDLLLATVKADDGILVNLASEEVKRLFDWQRISAQVKVIQPRFLVNKGGKLKTIVVYAKTCRGAMTRYLIRNRIADAQKLLTFEYEGFTYTPHPGDENHPEFIIL